MWAFAGSVHGRARVNLFRGAALGPAQGLATPRRAAHVVLGRRFFKKSHFKLAVGAAAGNVIDIKLVGRLASRCERSVSCPVGGLTVVFDRAAVVAAKCRLNNRYRFVARASAWRRRRALHAVTVVNGGIDNALVARAADILLLVGEDGNLGHKATRALGNVWACNCVVSGRRCALP